MSAALRYCPFCGVAVEQKGPCSAQKCQAASTRIPQVVDPSRGVTRGRETQKEDERVRKGTLIRLLPDAQARFRAYVRAMGLTQSEAVERWILSLPDYRRGDDVTPQYSE